MKDIIDAELSFMEDKTYKNPPNKFGNQSPH